MAVAAGPSSGKGKSKATDPVIEWYDIEESDTFNYGKEQTSGFYRDVKFSDCVRQDTTFNNCTMVNVTFENCNFNDTLFANVYLKDVEFHGCEFDRHTWMNDRLEQHIVTKDDLEIIFLRASKIGAGIPFEVIDAGFLQMQLALTDDPHIEPDEVLARRLQEEEDSQPAPHVPDVNDTGEQDDEPSTREGCLKWTHHSGPAVGQKAHSGYNAGVVTGHDKYGFPQVEHPSFPSWLPTTVETIDISGGITATKTTAGRSAAIMRNTIYEKEANEVVAPDTFTAHQQIDIPSSSATDEALPPHARAAIAKRRVRDATRALGDQSSVDSSSSSAENHGIGNSRLVNNSAAPSLTRQLDTNSGSSFKQHDGKVRSGKAAKTSPSRHFRLGYQERREKEAASAAMLQAPARIQSADEVARIDAWNNATLAAARAADERQARERTSATIPFTRSAAEIAAITKRRNAGSIPKVDTNSHELIDISAFSNPGHPQGTAPVVKPPTSKYVTTEMARRTKRKLGVPEPVRSLHAAPKVDTPMNAPSVTDLFGDGTKSARRVFRLAGSSDNTPRIFNSSSGSATVSHATQAEDTPEYATVAGGGFGSDGGVRLPESPLFKTGVLWDGDENLIEL
ncbi:hypothetical protein LTR27_002432 [Elasticomyces elasticus]|nr:hypothetical protein LTR27_002432 [Elasticomyces elasticus]